VEDFDGQAELDFLLDERRQIDFAINYGQLVVTGAFSVDLLETDTNGTGKSAQATVANELDLGLDMTADKHA
jgi:hypothetical protein